MNTETTTAPNIYLPIEPYLKQWTIHEHDGITPVKFHKGSVECKILKVYLTQTPVGFTPACKDENSLEVEIPVFHDKPAESFNYLPQRAEKILLATLRNRFDIQLFNDMLMLSNLARRQDQLIYAWMETHGIELTETNWNAIAKRYQRQRKRYLNAQRQHRYRQLKKNISKSTPNF
jgi:hypothetical protein